MTFSTIKIRLLLTREKERSVQETNGKNMDITKGKGKKKQKTFRDIWMSQQKLIYILYFFKNTHAHTKLSGAKLNVNRI